MVGNVLTERLPHIGFVYITMSADDHPAEYFGGGTWEKIEGKFLLAASDAYPVESTGGEAAHTLTIDEMPSHNHALYGSLTAKNEQISNSGNNWAQTTTAWEQSKYIKNTGGGEPHNNMPPYLTIYIWRRIA